MSGDDEEGMADEVGTGGDGRDANSTPLVEGNPGFDDAQGVGTIDVYGGPDRDDEADGLAAWLEEAVGETWFIAADCVGDGLDSDGVTAEVVARGEDPANAVAVAGVLARRYPEAEDQLGSFLYAAGFDMPGFVDEEEWVDSGGRSHGRSRPPADDDPDSPESGAGDDSAGRSGGVACET